MRIPRNLLTVLAALIAIATSGLAHASPVECRSVSGVVKAITDPDYHYITTAFQFDNPNLQTLLTTTIAVSGTGFSCIIAHFSALARITDNYIVFQVRVDGVPMEGHISTVAGQPTPAVFVSLDETSDFTDEQLSDPTKVASFNFFSKVRPGNHTIEVMTAAGSGIDPANYPQVGSPTLTLEYR